MFWLYALTYALLWQHPIDTHLILANRSSNDWPIQQVYVVTAYTDDYASTGKHPGDAGYGVTASGETATAGHTLACSAELPFGTEVYIPGLGKRVCSDRGQAITGEHLDVFMDSEQQALDWGRQALQVTIVEGR